MGIPYAEVIGDPIAHSKSPLIHNFWLEKLGIVAEYRALRVTREELPGYLHERRSDPDWRGCNVTMPLKAEARSLVDHQEPSVRRIGALNTIIRYDHDGATLMGANSDWLGVHFALEGVPLAGASVVIIGTGGAARAALEEMRQAKVDRVTLISRSQAKAEALLRYWELRGDVAPLGTAPAGDVLINGSPLGMTGYPDLQIDLSALPKDAVVFDMIYDPVETPLLANARSRGLRTVDGLSMLINQAAMAFNYFFKDSPAGQYREEELRELLTR